MQTPKIFLIGRKSCEGQAFDCEAVSNTDSTCDGVEGQQMQLPSNGVECQSMLLVSEDGAFEKKEWEASSLKFICNKYSLLLRLSWQSCNDIHGTVAFLFALGLVSSIHTAGRISLLPADPDLRRCRG
eukprot:605786-Amphidinium_carterae.1